jgi:hypothetical protein
LLLASFLELRNFIGLADRCEERLKLLKWAIPNASHLEYLLSSFLGTSSRRTPFEQLPLKVVSRIAGDNGV